MDHSHILPPTGRCLPGPCFQPVDRSPVGPLGLIQDRLIRTPGGSVERASANGRRCVVKLPTYERVVSACQPANGRLTSLPPGGFAGGDGQAILGPAATRRARTRRSDRGSGLG